jgi:hypothetical protein
MGLPTEKSRPSPIGRAGLHIEFRVRPRETETYLSELLIEVYCVFRFVPRPLTTAIIASAIPAAIRPYSIAVAPDSSDRNLSKFCFKVASFEFQWWQSCRTTRTNIGSTFSFKFIGKRPAAVRGVPGRLAYRPGSRQRVARG